ncbi:uncharacterized protein PFL1_02650 [Pseudozyma flocculosa PF-1]|uniref:Actin n=2 Tax=Pseudozyma flocculosa TaxID=84751 RepID=A0A5C3EYE9_9BASI|nr:uncharacterized protein PFL1_02650 [Pseudozyma flocculosa PF-1]EPQ29977.1 hypothetical protein PFL1_02650 [Pseudozyma flocculosa PF-1]SPO37293.1 uncharacterized protein PSFLO_02766 [Pseudozyma flocculosa]
MASTAAASSSDLPTLLSGGSHQRGTHPNHDRSLRKASSGSSRPPLHPASGSGAGASGSSSAAVKRHSLFGTEDRIVLDIGSRVSKFGFSGEEKPRAIVDSVPLSLPSTSRTALAETDALWDQDVEMAQSEQLRKHAHALLVARLTHLVRTAFFHHLMVEPKQRNVLVIENASMPAIVKQLLCKVLLSNLQVPSVSFVPSHLMALVAAGSTTGLVIECGYLETSVMPIYYGRPMSSSLRSTTRAGRALNRRLRGLLLHHAKFLPAHTAAPTAASRQKAADVPRALLTDDLLEHIKAKALIVGPYDADLDRISQTQKGTAAGDSEASMAAPSSAQSAADAAIGGLPASSSATQSSTNPFADVDGSAEGAASAAAAAAAAAAATATTASTTPSLNRLYRDLKLYDESDDEPKMRALKAAYRRSTKATPIAVALPPRPASGPSASPASSSSFHTADPSLAPGGSLIIPGWIRDRAAEVLFESADDEDEEAGPSIVELTVDVIRRLPIDLRKTMCESILVIGGTAMMPGMVNRFRVQLEAALKQHETSRTYERLHRHRRGAGAGVVPSPRSNSGVEAAAEQQETATAAHNDAGLLYQRIAVLNDPWPRISPDTGRPQGGTAPAFAANLLPFVGTSLLGELKTAPLSEITREAYEEALAVAEKLRKATTGESSGVPPQQAGGGGSSVTRPMLGPGNRGSFVGVVGGLETGAFGALAAVSRHLLIGGHQARLTQADGTAAGGGGGGAGGGHERGAAPQPQQLRSPTGLAPLRSPPLP